MIGKPRNMSMSHPLLLTYIVAVTVYVTWGSATIMDLKTIYFGRLVSYQPVEVGLDLIHHICSDFAKPSAFSQCTC